MGQKKITGASMGTNSMRDSLGKLARVAHPLPLIELILWLSQYFLELTRIER